MAKRHDKRGRVAEPVQVYLARDERDTLKRMAEQLGLSMSDVIRRALTTLEQTVLHPDVHPGLRLIGMADRETGTAPPYDVAVQHDRFLADTADPSGRRTAKQARRRGR
jgi:hypothetical protein